MSADIRRIPRDQRLHITAKYEKETVCYEGNVFEFIERLIADKFSGPATVHFKSGGVMAMEFDMRREVPIRRDGNNGKTRLDIVPDASYSRG